MKKLAKREEQIMQVLWELGKAFVKEVVEMLPEPKPHYNSVSTMIRILEDKGFLSHQIFGNTHRYFPLVSKEDYQKEVVDDVVEKYFDSSFPKMVTYFAKKEKISEKELEQIIEAIKKKNQ